MGREGEDTRVGVLDALLFSSMELQLFSHPVTCPFLMEIRCCLVTDKYTRVLVHRSRPRLHVTHWVASRSLPNPCAWPSRSTFVWQETQTPQGLFCSPFPKPHRRRWGGAPGAVAGSDDPGPAEGGPLRHLFSPCAHQPDLCCCPEGPSQPPSMSRPLSPLTPRPRDRCGAAGDTSRLIIQVPNSFFLLFCFFFFHCRFWLPQ